MSDAPARGVKPKYSTFTAFKYEMHPDQGTWRPGLCRETQKKQNRSTEYCCFQCKYHHRHAH